MDKEDLQDLGIRGTPEEVVLRWAAIAAEEEVGAIMCPPKETRAVLELNPHFTVINPGIRFLRAYLKTCFRDEMF